MNISWPTFTGSWSSLEASKIRKKCKFSSSKMPFPILEVQPNVDQISVSYIARRKRYVVKRRRKEEKKRRKREEIGRKIGDQIAKKKKKKKKVRAHLFPLRSRRFLDQSEITLFRAKLTISTFVFMQDEQIMGLLRAENSPPPPFFLQYF